MKIGIDFLFLGSKITADGTATMKSEGDCFLAGKLRKKLDRVLKSRDTTLPTKVHIFNATVFL